MGAQPAFALRPPAADLVLTNGYIYTADAAHPRASAIAVKNGDIVFVGDNAGAARLIGSSTRVVDLAGRMAAPGFHDMHMHPMSGGMRFLRCNLQRQTTPEAAYAAVRDCAARAAEEYWLIGFGLDFKIFGDAGPTRAALDALCPDRPAFLTSEQGDVAWVNSRALEAAAIDAPAPDSADTASSRDAASGVVAGAMAMRVRRAIPTPSSRVYRQALQLSLQEAARYGVTTILDASVTPQMLDAYVEAESAGELSARIIAAQRVDPTKGVAQIDAMANRARRITGEYLRADAIKLFVDGEFENHSAELIDPYSDRPGDAGTLNFQPEVFREIVRQAEKKRLQTHFHAIGDRAVRAALDALAEAALARKLRGRRHQIAHIGLVADADLPRFREYGAAANFEPQLAPANDDEKLALKAVLGGERLNRLYPFARLLHAGAMIVAGSDWPSPSMNPLVAIAVALKREEQNRSGSSPEIASLGLNDMLGAYTINGARAARHEIRVGSIELGKAADIVVFDRNLFDLSADDIAKANVLMTLIAGRTVYSDPSIARR